MKNIYYTLLASLFINTLFSQKEAAMWNFGSNAALDFNSGSPVALVNSALNTLEGSASISDKNGNLLFYTNAKSVWNKNNVTMPNGTGLIGNAANSSTQTALIIPRPGSTTLYYIFTLPDWINGLADGLRYNIVDITLNGGLGDVTSKNNLLFAASSEKITSVKHCNGIDYWVITHDKGNTSFRVFLVTAAGISAPSIYNLGTSFNTTTADEIGQMKASPDGSKLVVVMNRSGINLFDFDNSTGVISNPIISGTLFPSGMFHGAEFSQDGTKLYITVSRNDGTSKDMIYQYDLCTAPASSVLLSPVYIGTPVVKRQLFFLQLAIDGKIYEAGSPSSGFLGVINNPNIAGGGCNYNDQVVSLAGKTATFGFPTFCQTFFDPIHLKDKSWISLSSTATCLDANFSYKIFNQVPGSGCIAKNNKPVSVQWDFGDIPSGANNFSTSMAPGHTYSSPGVYRVKLVVQFNCKSDTVYKDITVNICSCVMSAAASVVKGITCSGASDGSANVTISNGTGGPYTYSWSSGTTGVTALTTHQIDNLSSGTYTVTITQGSCIATSTVSVTQPKSLSVGVSTLWSCYTNTGTATALSSDGTSPYVYSWSNGQTSTTITNISLGITYTVTTTDANGCVATRTLVPAILPMVITTVSVNNGCNSVGGASVTVSSGASPYSYSWSSGQTTSAISNLTSGGYTVTVTDGNGCTQTKVFNITGVNPVSATFTNPSPCIGQQVCFTNTGTMGTYSWSVGFPANVSGTTVNFCYTFLTMGTYSVRHTTTNAGCSNTVTKDIVVTNCTGPAVTATGNSVCPGSCATVSSSGSGGTSPYTYSWSNGSTAQNINPCPVSTTTYTVTIRDAGGSTSTSTAIVTINPPVTVTVTATGITCNGGTDGSAVANAGSGTPGYTYSWSTGATTAQIANLTSQTYTLKVTDSKGCTSTSTATIISPPALVGQFTKGTASCVGCGCKEWLMVNATGGTSPYSYSWPDGYVNRYKNQLCPGAYMVNISDKNGCSVNVNLSAP